MFAVYNMTGRLQFCHVTVRHQLIGYCHGIRSERQLCDEVNFNLAYRWFCHLGLENDVPDHSTFSKNRHGRYRDSDLFRRVFETVVQRCLEQGLVKGESFAIDASYVRADVARKRTEDSPVNWAPAKVTSRAVTEYLATLDADPALRRPQVKVSLTDPMAQWSSAKGLAEFYYSTNYLVDIEHGVIMDVEASPSTHALEVATTRTMINRVETNYNILPTRLLTDTAYGAAENLGYVVDEKRIEPTSWSGKNRNEMTAPIVVPTSPGAITTTRITAHRVKRYGQRVMSPRSRRCCIALEIRNARPVLTSPNVAPTHPTERLPAMLMKRRVTSHAPLRAVKYTPAKRSTNVRPLRWPLPI